MHSTGSDQLPAALQLDHLVFELLDPIHQLDDGARQRLLARARHYHLGPGERLDSASAAGHLLYLLQGQIGRTIPGLGRTLVDALHGGSAEPLIPEGIAPAAAAGARIESITHSAIIGFDRALFQHLLEEAHRPAGSLEDLVLEGPESALFQQLMDDFHGDALQIQRLPNLAEETLKRLHGDPDDTAGTIRLIEGDPALAVRLTRTAREPSIAAAVTGLGAHQVRGIILSHTMEQACQVRSPLIRARLQRAHRHSREVAAFSQVLATHNAQMDAGKALLCGLLHDVGVFPILCRADAMMDRIGNGLALDAMTRRLHGMIGALMLGRWGYDSDVVMCAEEADNWHRDPAPTADYADVVLVAQLHSFIGSSRAHSLPQFAAVPAFGKVTKGEASPQNSLWLLNRGRRRIQEMDDECGGSESSPRLEA